MSRPFIDEIKQYTETVDTFAGLDRRHRIAEGRFSAMKNMSSRKYPLLATRQKRGLYKALDDCGGLISKEKLCYVSGTGMYIGGNDDDDFVEMGLDTMSDKQLVSFGSYIIVLPDKKYINYADITDRGDIEASFATAYGGSKSVSVIPCKADGTSYTIKTYGDVPPENPENGEYWLDTSGKTPELKQYSSYSMSWASVVSTYLRITCGNSIEGWGIGMSLSEGDAVTVTVSDEAVSSSSGLKKLNTTAVISAITNGGTSIVIPGILDKIYTFTGITVERRMPVMDYVIESGNRLWGCRHGTNAAGEIVNEIYASKLGDFKNWNVFEGVSTDSYAASVGSDGKFTGAVSYRGYPHFFKEHTLHKVMGSTPASYQISSAEIDGVSEKCGGSLAVVDNVLYYKSRTGVCAYDGSFPANVGEVLGRNVYTDAVAGDVLGMYYISMGGSLYCYDTGTGIWSLEDDTTVKHFCEHQGVLYYTDGKSIYTVNGNETEADFDWFAETGDIGISVDEHKYVSRLVIRMRLALGARMKVSISYDSSGAWETLYNADGGKMRTYNVSVRPKRCDHFRLRIEGRGECDIYSVTKYLEYGSIF